MPPFVSVAPTLSNILLDLREAAAAAQMVQLTVHGIAGSVVLVVPEGWGIDTDRLGKGLGSVRNGIGPLAVQGYPVVVVTGTMGFGSFVARRERFYERWGRRDVPWQAPRELLC